MSGFISFEEALVKGAAVLVVGACCIGAGEGYLERKARIATYTDRHFGNQDGDTTSEEIDNRRNFLETYYSSLSERKRVRAFYKEFVKPNKPVPNR